MNEVRLTEEQALEAFYNKDGMNLKEKCLDVANAQIDRLHSWGNEPCPHCAPSPTQEEIDCGQYILKRECDKCWESLVDSLKKEEGDGDAFLPMRKLSD